MECRAGKWDDAARYADEGYESILQTGREPGGAALLFAKALVDAHLGQADEARAAAGEGLMIAERTGNRQLVIQNLSVLGFLELSLGNPAEAHRYLGRAADLLGAMDIGEPGVFPFLPDEIEALIALGQLAKAHEILEGLEQQSRTLDRASALAAAARCRGMLAAARGDHDAALLALEHALSEHERVPRPFERGRTLLALGSIQRRGKQKRAARESLQEALAIFEELGAVLWAKKARAELARVGGRAPTSEALTPTEERVAALVAEGRTNRDVASALFITPRTVEGHLSKIYAKLGVRSRTELARRFAAADGARDES